MRDLVQDNLLDVDEILISLCSSHFDDCMRILPKRLRSSLAKGKKKCHIEDTQAFKDLQLNASVSDDKSKVVTKKPQDVSPAKLFNISSNVFPTPVCDCFDNNLKINSINSHSAVQLKPSLTSNHMKLTSVCKLKLNFSFHPWYQIIGFNVIEKIPSNLNAFQDPKSSSIELKLSKDLSGISKNEELKEERSVSTEDVESVVKYELEATNKHNNNRTSKNMDSDRSQNVKDDLLTSKKRTLPPSHVDKNISSAAFKKTVYKLLNKSYMNSSVPREVSNARIISSAQESNAGVRPSLAMQYSHNSQLNHQIFLKQILPRHKSKPSHVVSRSFNHGLKSSCFRSYKQHFSFLKSQKSVSFSRKTKVSAKHLKAPCSLTPTVSPRIACSNLINDVIMNVYHALTSDLPDITRIGISRTGEEIVRFWKTVVRFIVNTHRIIIVTSIMIFVYHILVSYVLH